MPANQLTQTIAPVLLLEREAVLVALEALLEKLLSRRRKVPELIEASRHARSDTFPNWK